MDIRNEEMVRDAIKKGVNHFISKGQGLQLDVVINNAGAISLINSENLALKKFIYELNLYF